MMYRLIVLNGPLMNQRVSVDPAPMLIGRDPACHICVPDEEMAREHAQIEHREDGLYITDLGSMNRILVNKREVREAKLKHGDMIEVGRTRFLVQALVQAEVEGARRKARRRKQWRGVGVAVVVVLGAVVVVNHWVEIQIRRMAAESAARAAEWSRLKSEVLAKITVHSVDGPEDDNAAERELQKVREDLAALREKMKAVVEREETSSVSAIPPTAATAPFEKRCEEFLALALDAIRRGQPMEAEQFLSGAIALDENFWPAYEERARLYERRGMAVEALRQWNDLIQKGPPPDVYERAVAERLRLGRAVRSGEARAVKIVSLDQHKVLAVGEFEEERVLRIGLQPKSPEYLLQPDQIRVTVDFYDENVQNGQIERTRAMVVPQVIHWSGPWRRDGTNMVVVKYAVPSGQRGAMRYYGFVVQVFYGDRLQEVAARPAGLVNSVRNRPLHSNPGG